MRERGLAVFTKAPIPGQVKTRLVLGETAPLTHEQAAQLYRCFLLDTLQRAQRVPDCHVFLFWTPPDEGAIIEEIVGELNQADRIELLPQSAGDLGARMNNAFRELFQRGMNTVVLTGADLPTLPASRLTQAFTRLEHKSVVLGPGLDGGYYLVGLCAPLPELFADIAWSTPQVMAQTMARLESLGLTVEYLEPWYDVDTGIDLQQLISDLKLGHVCRDADLPSHTANCLRQFGELD